MTANTIYTLDILGLATELAAYPLRPDMVQSGEVVSRICGSRVTAGLTLNSEQKIFRVGGQISSCAIGQASAAILFKEAVGKSRQDIARSFEQLGRYLDGSSDHIANWPRIEMIANIKEHKGRHQAVLLPWQAVLDAFARASAVGHAAESGN